MDGGWNVVLSFLPEDWRALARETGALKGLRKDKSVDALLRTLLLHLACGHSLRETVVRARKVNLADLSDVALLKRLRKSKARQSPSWTGPYRALDDGSGAVFIAAPRSRDRRSQCRCCGTLPCFASRPQARA